MQGKSELASWFERGSSSSNWRYMKNRRRNSFLQIQTSYVWLNSTYFAHD